MIVESPAKAKTINKYLGANFTVKASMGHVRDIPKQGLNVDVEHSFTPTYAVLDTRKKLVAELKAAARTASEVYLATDLDREGEAIAWHLVHALGLDLRGPNASCSTRSRARRFSTRSKIHAASMKTK